MFFPKWTLGLLSDIGYFCIFVIMPYFLLWIWLFHSTVRFIHIVACVVAHSFSLVYSSSLHKYGISVKSLFTELLRGIFLLLWSATQRGCSLLWSLADQCLLHSHLPLQDWSFLISKRLPTYLSQLLIVLVKGGVEGWAPSGFPGNWWPSLISIPVVIGTSPSLEQRLL